MPNNQEQFKSLLKHNGLKVTTQRIAILEVLNNRPGKHMTAEEIYDCVKKKYPEIGLATVYRTIQLLSELHVIDKLNLDDGYVRYEIGGRSSEEACHHHHHLICKNCSKIIEVKEDLLENIESQIQEIYKFNIIDHDVKFYGLCEECRK